MSGQNDVIHAWLSRVVTNSNQGEPGLVICEASLAFIERVNLLGLDVKGRFHGLDDSLTRHLLRQHGSPNEYARGQVPITLKEIVLLHQYAELGLIKLPKQQFDKTGKKRLESNYQVGNLAWTIVLEFRSKLIVPVTAWKKIVPHG